MAFRHTETIDRQLCPDRGHFASLILKGSVVTPSSDDVIGGTAGAMKCAPVLSPGWVQRSLEQCRVWGPEGKQIDHHHFLIAPILCEDHTAADGRVICQHISRAGVQADEYTATLATSPAPQELIAILPTSTEAGCSCDTHHSVIVAARKSSCNRLTACSPEQKLLSGSACQRKERLDHRCQPYQALAGFHLQESASACRLSRLNQGVDKVIGGQRLDSAVANCKFERALTQVAR